MTTKGKRLLLIAIIATVFLFAIVIGLVIYFSNKKLAQEANGTDVPPVESIAVTTTGTKTKEYNPTEGWKTVKVESHGLQFKYPEKLGNPEKEEYIPGEVELMPSVRSQIIRFTGNNALELAMVDVMSIADYKENNEFSEKLAKIQTIYESSSAEGANELTATFLNAGVLISSPAEYIETADKKYRGIYYFANIGQAYSTKLSCVIVMTDNKNIIQFLYMQDADNASRYEADLNDENSTLARYIKALNEDSDESTTRNFKETYKLMALSLEEL
ncbi:hypothetical protein KBB60_00235 [Patescibacteria group bacterium]|nr:hypothetical protein [Patescibacteria group bacterium]